MKKTPVFKTIDGCEAAAYVTYRLNETMAIYSSLPFDPNFSAEPKIVVPVLFYGLGADGTVGANKNSIKINPPL